MSLWSVSCLGRHVLFLSALVGSACLLTGTMAYGRAATAATTSTSATKKAIQGAQERLQALGYQPGSTDGVMGAKTAAALKKFQSDHGLPVTGILDSKTTDALREGSAAAISSTPAASPATPAEVRPVAPAASSPLKLTVKSTEVGTKFTVYVGGGANISSPSMPSAFGGGGGIPMISISNGSSFLAGEVRSRDGSTKFIRISLTVSNPTQDALSFKIGDVALVSGKTRTNDFAAVGYGSKMCAMGDADRNTVKKIVVDVAPGETENLSYLFALMDANATQGQVALGNSAPVTFDIDSQANR